MTATFELASKTSIFSRLRQAVEDTEKTDSTSSAITLFAFANLAINSEMPHQVADLSAPLWPSWTATLRSTPL
jgi:hypothetical protein